MEPGRGHTWTILFTDVASHHFTPARLYATLHLVKSVSDIGCLFSVTQSLSHSVTQ